MSVQFRSIDSSTTTSGTSAIVNKAAGAVNNTDVLEIRLDIYNDSFTGSTSGVTVTPPAGFTQRSRIEWEGVAGGGTSSSQLTFTKLCGAAEPSTYTFTFSSSCYAELDCSAYSGCDASTANAHYDTSATFNGTGTAATGSLTVAANDSIVLFHTSGNSGALSSGSFSGVTQRVNYDSNVYTGTKDIPTAGATGSLTATYATSQGWVVTVLALKPSSGGGGGGGVVDVPALKLQQRAKGFPPRAPRPGINTIGRGWYKVDTAMGTYVPPVVPGVDFDAGTFTLQPMSTRGTGLARQPLPGINTIGRGWYVVGPPSAAVAFTSTGTSALSVFASGAVGTVTFAAIGSAALSPFASAGTGIETHACTATSSLSPFASAGTAVETYACTASSLLQPFASAGTGAEQFTSTAGSLLQPFGSSGVATYGFACSGTSAIQSFASAGAGAETFASVGSSAASSFACSAVGTEQFSSAAGSLLQPFGSSGNGATGTVFTSTCTSTLQPFASAATGTEGFVGTAGSAASSFGSVAAGTEQFSCTAGSLLQPFGSIGNAAIGTVFTCTGTTTLSTLASAAVGAETFAGVGAATLTSFACSGTGLETFAASVAIACSPFASAGTGAEQFTSSAVTTCQPFGSIGNAATGTVFTSTCTTTLQPLMSAAVGTETFAAAGAAECSSFGSAAVGAEQFSSTAVTTCQPFGSAGVATFAQPIMAIGDSALVAFGSNGFCVNGSVFNLVTSRAAHGQQSVMIGDTRRKR